MPVAARIASLCEIAKTVANSDDFAFALGDFLDGFRAHPSRAALAAEPPLLTGRIANGEHLDAYLGAVAEHLSHELRWPVPAWARDVRRFLDRPCFGMKNHGGRMVLLAESPAAFRVRNIFVSANALSRA